MATRNVAAVDLGAKSGRVMLARFDGRGLSLEEVHRFSLLLEDILPKYLTPMRRHVVACLAPPLAAFGSAVLAACVRLKSLDRKERASIYYICLLEDARQFQAGHQGV